ncbi:major facilitator superfamily domain-containing protein 6-like [Actinia tenebrosa]|uniref:Major facilitator superfamily domain-containing protein 6-like n=1 Tax=Actinia tenebrosa TaxID=6105 RepID=A0A6P8IPL9_ACTTE|nr:major facilitator superfamily domain-containing protein 6-like [Actinia tenebrosa]
MDGEEIHDFSWAAPSRLSRTLLAPKLFRVFYGACYITMVPFLPMYFRFLGLTAFQSGILGCLRSLISCWSSFLWCIFSEKLAKRKCFLVVLLLIGIILNISVSFVYKQDADFMEYVCHEENVFKNESSFLHAENKSLIHVRSLAFGMHERDMTEAVTKTKRQHQDLELNRTKALQREKEDSVFIMYGFRMDVLFRNLLLITAFAEFFMSAVKLISDSIFADFLHFSKGSVAKSKAWTSLGEIFGAGLVILVIGHYHCSFGLKNSFYIHFYLFGFLGSAAFLFASILHVYEPKTSMIYRFGRACKFVSCNMHALATISILFALGMAESLMSNYMMWYLQDIKASITVMGLMIVIGTFSELCTLFLSKYLIRFGGYTWVFALALLAYSAHFACFSFITNQWLILPVQLFQGLSMTCVWSACSAYAAEVAPIGMERTLNGIMSVVYWGIGHGMGGIGVALLYNQYGPVVVFRCGAGVCIIYALLFILLQCLLKIPDGRFGKLKEYHQLTYDDGYHQTNYQTDWLLEALEAEEEDTHFVR